MRWIIDLNDDQPLALAWAPEFLAEFDLSLLAWIRIDRGRGKYRGAYGRCWFPTRSIPFYRISCQVPGPFPCDIVTRKPPLYLQPNGKFLKAPAGTRKGEHIRDERSGREWIRVTGKTRLQSLDEGIVWVLAHEAFHFLRRTKQIPGRNTEIQADQFGDDTLLFFRTGR